MNLHPLLPLGLCCTPKEAESLDPAAFDFIEVNVQNFLVPGLDDSAFLPHLEQARAAVKPVKSANCFLPGALKCVGPAIDSDRLLRYAGTAFTRARRVGIDTIVFGSGAARIVPDGYPHPQALHDFVRLLRLLAPIAQHHAITLVIEPLNKGECNFINSLAQGAEAVEQCAHPNVRLLADFYHMLKEAEPASEIARYGHLIKHTHAAELAGRSFPGKSRENFRPFFQALREARYTGAIALECAWDDLQADLTPSAQYIRHQMA